MLLTNNADIDAQDKAGNTPLHSAARKGNKDIAVLLLNKGAKLDIRNNNSFTPLHSATVNDQK